MLYLFCLRQRSRENIIYGTALTSDGCVLRSTWMLAHLRSQFRQWYQRFSLAHIKHILNTTHLEPVSHLFEESNNGCVLRSTWIFAYLRSRSRQLYQRFSVANIKQILNPHATFSRNLGCVLQQVISEQSCPSCIRFARFCYSYIFFLHDLPIIELESWSKDDVFCLLYA